MLKQTTGYTGIGNIIMNLQNLNIRGLRDAEVEEAREKFGPNRLELKKEHKIGAFFKSLAKEPMVILLLVTASIYFLIGETGDGIFLAASIILVASISWYQDSRSRNALEKLKSFSQARCKVIRNGEVIQLKNEDLVLGDSFLVEEGDTIVADGVILHSYDFSVNESLLTGESHAVHKDAEADKPFIFSGTTVSSGLSIAKVTAIGNQTELGKIGKSLESIQEGKTPLQIQINQFVNQMMLAGALVFAVVWAINYFRSFQILDSLSQALTLAMSILPEEIPVAFTTFMALGAWRLMKMGIVVKQMRTVETLGAATVICTDKTGTITENSMDLAKVFVLESSQISSVNASMTEAEKELIRIGMWASEPLPFDPMELALHEAYLENSEKDERRDFRMIHEYPLGGKPPMMTHLFENERGERIIAAKGAPEAFLRICKLDSKEKEQIGSAIQTLANDGYRLLGVGEAQYTGSSFPENQEDLPFQFKGLLAFYDPPKKNISSVFKDFYSAGICVKIITGDNATTTKAIARQVNFKGNEKSLSGEEVMQMSTKELQGKLAETHVFTRMFPDAKLKVIHALKAEKEVVAMVGDGVNDGPALKAAHIGIAMGKKGTELAKEAASLILLEDNLAKVTDAIVMGRKIYTNLKKAIQYIISIHIPIILLVFIPLALGWIYPNIFSPVHVIFLELIMGPTCSIVYESEPIEKNTMRQKPRPFRSTFFSWKELSTSIIQGLIITAGLLVVYQYAVSQGLSEAHTRTMVFSTLISANIFLTLVNRSFYYSIWTTVKYKNNLVPWVILITISLLGLLLFVKPLTSFFEFDRLDIPQLLLCIIIGFCSVIWYEGVKWTKRTG